MSDLSQGPGSWQASDGKWYRAEQHPGYQPPVTVPTAVVSHPTAPHSPAAPRPMAPPPAMNSTHQAGAPAYGPAPAKKGGKGCTIALVVFLVLMLGGVAAAVVGIKWVGNKIDSGDAFGKTTCDAISDADVSTTLGGSYSALQLGGVTNIAAPVLDARVLADGKTCWIQPNGAGRSVRVATVSSGDLAARFRAEKTKAMGATEDRGNGLSVETEGYFAKDVALGDEAFCTKSDVLGYAGVLVRTGNSLTYVSVDGGGFSGSGQPSPEDIGRSLGNDDEKCALAQKVAAKTK